MFFESEILGERKRPSDDGRFLLYKGYEKDTFAFCIKDSNSNGLCSKNAIGGSYLTMRT